MQQQDLDCNSKSSVGNNTICMIHIKVLSPVSFSHRKPAVVADVMIAFWSPGHYGAFLQRKGVGTSAITVQFQILGVQNYLPVYNPLLTYSRIDFPSTSAVNTASCIATSLHM